MNAKRKRKHFTMHLLTICLNCATEIFSYFHKWYRSVCYTIRTKIVFSNQIIRQKVRYTLLYIIEIFHTVIYGHLSFPLLQFFVWYENSLFSIITCTFKCSRDYVCERKDNTHISKRTRII